MDEQDGKPARPDGPRQFAIAFGLAFLVAFAWMIGFPWLLRGIRSLVAALGHGP